MNAETNWTLGPRQVQYRGDLCEYHTLAEGGATIGAFANRGDALLDAAAPDLLRACEAMQAAFVRHPGNADERHHALTLASAALAKARGS